LAPSGIPEQRQAVMLASINEAIVKATGAKSGVIELSTMAKVFTVKVVNGKFTNSRLNGSVRAS
jgi:hypothetical protein